MTKRWHIRARFLGFQIIFWIAAAIVLAAAQSMEMPRRFAIPPAVSMALLGFASSFGLATLFGVISRFRHQWLLAFGIIVTMAFTLTPLSKFLAFSYLELDYRSFQWVYFFQGTLRLVLLYALWSVLFLWLGRHFGRGYWLAAQRFEEKGAEPTHLRAERRRTTSLVPLKDILLIETAADYVAIVTDVHEYLRRDTLKSLEQTLPSESFVRVHRSSIVNLAKVAEVDPLPKGDFIVTLQGGRQVKGSRRYKANFSNLLDPMAV